MTVKVVVLKTVVKRNWKMGPVLLPPEPDSDESDVEN